MIVVAILFAATNFYLLLKDDSPVARSMYIDQWTSAKEQNLTEMKKTEGVTIPLRNNKFTMIIVKEVSKDFWSKKGKLSHLEHPYSSTLPIPIKKRSHN